MRILCALAAVLCTSACAAVGGVTDGTSVSYGWSNRGRLVNPAHLPPRGDGYIVPPTWATRGLSYGTDEMIGLIVRVARKLQMDETASLLYVADMSPPRGGPSAWHKSHQTGRDCDLLFFAVDAEGRRAPPTSSMISFDNYGQTAPVDGVGRLYFDIERNWHLVRALLEDDLADVQFLFISRPLREMLLNYARAMAEPPEVIERAEAMLVQPGDSAPHDDHLHVRIYCSASDRVLGCYDRGPLRWFKKSYKYLQARGKTVEPVHTLDAMAARPFCRFLAASLYAYL
jgi:penicillin-insensitive murein endopeptidase